MATVRLTMAEALVRYLAAQHVDIGGKTAPLFGGVFAIFGHGNVAGLGPALHAVRRALPTLRAHNEQAMALAAIAFAKTNARRRILACTTSIGPGATNLVTAAALAHVNRLPVLFLPGDIFASRRPDPALQQVENFGDGTVSANDCLRPVSRYFDRILRPEQILTALPAAIRVLTDPAECGPATLALPQDVQAESFDCPRFFLEPHLHRLRRPAADGDELAAAVAALMAARRPLFVAGGGVKYSGAERALAEFAERRGVPVAETQAGKGSLPWDHARSVGGIGVTGSAAANALAARADMIVAIGTRLQDFTTGSWTVLPGAARLLSINVQAFDAAKRGAQALIGDARTVIEALDERLGRWRATSAWTARAARLSEAWQRTVSRIAAPQRAGLPTDAQVVGAVNRASLDRRGGRGDIVVCAAGGLPGELHKLWRAADSTSYHLEYGYSCMGYEIAGGLGAKLARPEREVFVLVGDGSYLMMNSEIATSIALRAKLIVVVLDNRGFGCIERLQGATTGLSFNNRLASSAPHVDFAAHARSLGAEAERVDSIGGLDAALARARRSETTYAIVIDTDPVRGTAEGGAWWDVPVSDVPRTRAARQAFSRWTRMRRRQRVG